MNTDKTTLRARAANLFAAEQRHQDLMGLALLQQTDFQTLDQPTENTTPSLDTIIHNSDQRLLNAQQHLQNARHRAAQLQAEDAQLNALNQQVYGSLANLVREDDIIEGEVIDDSKTDNLETEISLDP
jgi:hypothetical protein